MKETIKEIKFSFEKLIAYQMTRAAVSISLNFGEGSVGIKTEFKNYLTISYRSLRECVFCNTLAKRRGYLTEDESNYSTENSDERVRISIGVRNSL